MKSLAFLHIGLNSLRDKRSPRQGLCPTLPIQARSSSEGTTTRPSLRVESTSTDVALHAVRVRDWQPGDVGRINDLLLQDVQSSSFDPEGLLAIDVGSNAAISESYDPADGGCFLVAIDDDDERESGGDIIGTAGLVVGTRVSYLKSGASMSTPDCITGAVRRVCVTGTAPNSEVLRSLLEEIEIRATQAGAEDLIILAYCSSRRRPSRDLLEGLGFEVVSAKLNGANVVQYRKDLNVTTANEGSDIDSSLVGDLAIGTSLIAGLLLATIGIAKVMGLGLAPSIDNRGFGSPLSIQEVERLKEDEALKRTDLDGGEVKGGRQWDDLSMEERREEAALMRIIQGKDIRLQ